MQKLLSTSPYQLTANIIFNQIEREYPEYSSFLSYLSVYQLQVWAREVRENLEVDISSLEEALMESSEYFGIRNISSNSLSYQKKSLEVTDEIISFIETVLEDDELSRFEKEAIQIGFYGDGDIQQMTFKKNFRDALIKLLSKYNSQFQQYADKVEAINADLDVEILVAYHDTEILLKLVSLLGRVGYVTVDINKNDVYSIVAEAIKALDDYPFADNVRKVTGLMFLGKQQKYILEVVGKQRDYVIDKYKKGLEALQCIFWGYTYNDRSIYFE